MNLGGSWEYIQGIARSRLAHNKTPHHVYEYGEGIEVLGVAGEIVARRFLGLPENELHSGFDNGVDIQFEGLSIDVKATVLTPKIEHRFLQWPLWKTVKAEIILLTAVDPMRKIGTVLGYATRDEVLAAPVNKIRPYPCREIPVTELHPAWMLAKLKTRDPWY